MTARTKKVQLGFILLLVWCITSAFSRIFTGHIEQALDPWAMCFYIMLFSNIFFMVVSLKNVKVLWHKSRSHLKDVIGANIATVGCWLFIFYPLKYLEPSISTTISLCVTPIATLVVGGFIYKKQIIKKIDLSYSGLMLLMALYLAVIGFLGKTAVLTIPLVTDAISVFDCALAGIALAFSNIYAKKLSDAGFLPVDTLSVRFILLIVVSGVITYSGHSHLMLPTMSDTLLAIAIAALTMIIIPQIAYQTAIRELQPISVAVVAPLMPIMAYGIEFFDKRLHLSYFTIIGLVLVFLISLISTLLRYRREKFGA